MRRESVITGLICLNLGLLAGLAYVWKQRPAAKTALPATDQEPTASTTGTRSVTRKIQSAGGAAAMPGRFTWRLLESADRKRYLDHLGSAGCPEQTIQENG